MGREGRDQAMLAPYVGESVSIITNDGRHIVGKLKGYDQMTNLILEGSRERVYPGAGKVGVDEIALGLYLLRGDCIAIVGQVDDEADSKIDLKTVKGVPLKDVRH